MSEENKILLRKTKSGKGYITNGFVPSEAFNYLLENKVMSRFPSKDPNTGEIRQYKGKDQYVNYISNENFDQLQSFCDEKGFELEVTQPK